MYLDTYQTQAVLVDLKSDPVMLKKAKKRYCTELLISICFCLVLVASGCCIWLLGGFRSTTVLICVFALLILAKDIVIALSGLRGVGQGTAKQTLSASRDRIVEEYRFGLFARTCVEKTSIDQVETATMFYNQLMLKAKGGRQIVLPYDLFSSREKMRSYAEAVCEKAGIELQVVEDVA